MPRHIGHFAQALDQPRSYRNMVSNRREAQLVPGIGNALDRDASAAANLAIVELANQTQDCIIQGSIRGSRMGNKRCFLWGEGG